MCVGFNLAATYEMASRIVWITVVTFTLSVTVGSPHPRLRANSQNGIQKRSLDVDWNAIAQQELMTSLRNTPKIKAAKNVILFIGDGMGISTLTAARFLKAQKTGTPVPDTALSWEAFSNTGLIKTYNTDQQTADSAGTATAFLTGQKARAGVIGVSQHVRRGNCGDVSGQELTSFITQGSLEDKWAGVVSTARITHATPASAYAHSPDRDWEDDSKVPSADRETCWDIARQLVHDEDNKELRVILGGGRRHMIPNNMSDPEYPDQRGMRTDGRDLRQEWLDIRRDMGISSSEYKYVENKTDFNAVDTSSVQYLMGLFEPNHMKYDMERRAETGDSWTEPSLAEMVRTAVNVLQRGPQGYVLMVEGGRIDHGHHDTMAYHALHDTLALDEAVQVAMEMTDADDTLLVVTADHSHVFTMGGYQDLNNDIFGVVVTQFGDTLLGDDNMPFQTLSYANGPGFYHHRTADGTVETAKVRRNLTGEQTDGIEYLQDAAVPLDSETHGGEDVAVYARGPMAHLFTGQHEQHYIAHAIQYTTCLGDSKELCDEPARAGKCDSGTDSVNSRLTVITLLVCVCSVLMC